MDRHADLGDDAAGSRHDCPSTPTGLLASAVSSSQINLSWTASTDNVGVTGYRVYRAGTLLATLAAVTSYQNTGLAASTSYSYTVQAVDAAGNLPPNRLRQARPLRPRSTPPRLLSPPVLSAQRCPRARSTLLGCFHRQCRRDRLQCLPQ